MVIDNNCEKVAHVATCNKQNVLQGFPLNLIIIAKVLIIVTE